MLTNMNTLTNQDRRAIFLAYEELQQAMHLFETGDFAGMYLSVKIVENVLKGMIVYEDPSLLITDCVDAEIDEIVGQEKPE